MNRAPQKIEISHRSVIFAVIFLISLWFLYFIRDIILTFFVSVLIMAVLNPTVTKFTRYKIPRPLSVFLVYLMLLVVVGVTIAAIIPALIEQTTNFVTNFPTFLDNLGFSVVLSDQIVEQLLAQLGTLPARVGRLVISLFSNVIGVVTVLVFAFYLLVDRHKLDKSLLSIFSESKSKDILKFVDSLEARLGGWARAQIALMFVVGLGTYVGLRLLGIPFSLPLSILAGLFEVIPFIGPTLAAIPAVIIGFGISPFMGLAVAALAFLVQQLENYVLVPKLMQRSTGINPIIILLCLTIGFRLAGFLGLLISVPIFITLQAGLQQYYASQEA